MAMPVLVHVVDDDAAVRDSTRALLASVDIDVAVYANGREFLAAPTTPRPGCILLDLRLPDISGVDIQRALVERNEFKPVIFLTGHAETDVTVRAMQQGAVDFLTKPVEEEVLLDKVRKAIDKSHQRQQLNEHRAATQARLNELSPRETEVLDYVVDGHKNKEIARLLGISPKTVELHRSNMRTKMQARSLAELIRMRLEVDAPINGNGHYPD